MAVVLQPPFTIPRKPLPGQGYAAVPQQQLDLGSGTDTASDVHQLDRAAAHDTKPHTGQADSLAESLLLPDLREVHTPDPHPRPADDPTHQDHPDTGSSNSHSIRTLRSEIQGHHYHGTPNETWASVWLHWAVLLAFCVLFVSLIAGLLVLAYFARVNNGISTQISSNHYYWTYGPTTVLMVVVALWRQVDHTCKRLTPWEELGPGQSNMPQGLLLDYISPFLTTSLLRAIRSRHWCIVTTVVGFLLLKLITIFSTGLLVLTSTQMFLDDAQLQTSSIITAKSYCPYEEENCTYIEPSITAILEYFGITSNGLPYPDGTSATVLFDLVDVTKAIPEGAAITTTVQGFYPAWDCQFVTIYNNSGFPPDGGFDSFEADQDPISSLPFNISVGDRTWTVADGALTFCNPGISICPPRAIGTFDLDITWLQGDEAADNLWLLVVNDVRYNQTISPILNKTALPSYETTEPNPINVTSWSAHLEAATAVMCEISYSMEETQLRVNTAQKETSHYLQATGPLTHTGTHLDGYSNDDFFRDFIDLLKEVYPAAFLTPDQSGLSMFELMSELNVVENASSYLNSDLLMNISARAFRMQATQLAYNVLHVPGKRNLTGSIVYFEDRLHVKALSLWVMVAGFAVMIMLTMAIFMSRPRPLLPQDPASMASCALILSSNQDFSNRMSDLGLASDSLLKAGVYSHGIDTASPTSTTAERVLAESRPVHLGRKNAIQSPVTSKAASWQPFAASFIFKICSAVALSATIVALAILQHVSDTNDGIANVGSSGTVTHSLSTYIPAAFMLLLATLCSSADFAIITMTPYYYLRRGRASAERTILLDIAGKAPIGVILKSLKRALIAALLISVASVLSSFLTIVVSGLYTTSSVPLSRQVQVDQLDHFSTTWNSSATDNNAMTVLDLIEHQNASYPSFTYNELTIPAISVTANQKAVLNAMKYTGDVSLSVSLPVLRASLNCTLIPKNDFGVVENPYHDTGTCEELNCGLGAAGNVPNSTFDVNAESSHCDSRSITVDYSLPLAYPPTAYNGGILGLSGCPSLAFTLGYFSTNTSLKYPNQDTTYKDNVTTFVCSQYIEESDTNVHFLFPSLSLDTAHPPLFNASNSRIVSTEQYHMTDYMSQLSSYPFYKSQGSSYGATPEPDIDPFMQIVISGTAGIPTSELIHPDNADRLISAVQHVYRKYMAQAINANMRQNFTESLTSRSLKTLDATLLDPTRMRLVQNRVSAIVLEVLLGLILILGVAAYASIRLSGVLTHNPCSIAGMMSLLAGSRLCGSEAEHLTELLTEKKHKVVFKRWRFSLGWWDGDGRVVERGGGDGMRFGIDLDHY